VSAAEASFTASGEQLAQVDALTLCDETFGEGGAPAMLLVMGWHRRCSSGTMSSASSWQAAGSG
jgi:hypothetical protein